jgi:hypothetical protein
LAVLSWDGERRSRKHRPSTKTAIIGAVSRKGNVVARLIGRISSGACQRFVREMLSDKVSLLATDESKVYLGLTGYNHQTVDHSRKQYVVGAVHTNTLKAFGASSSAAWSAGSTKRPPNIGRCMSRSFSSATTINSDIFGTAKKGC